ncbi:MULTISPECIES: hypothetical protein [Sphingobium]|jgi:hypothetical protein|uniref:hypothetical protein n=1 Tax=Sphingobium TaxID=165695 RepID=UPI001D19804A|nr:MULTISPECIES: hypothetical protein [Sphingobium]MCC4258592.1 hypothetical protein [Sphingobium lactosutens]|tara:strand:- start:603 stop:818 length:216 start_codon:yes stop_codon:yes gene_type:complete
MPSLTHIGPNRLKNDISLDMKISPGPLGQLLWSQRQKIPDYDPKSRYVIYCANSYYDITEDGYANLGPDYD